MVRSDVRQKFGVIVQLVLAGAVGVGGAVVQGCGEADEANASPNGASPNGASSANEGADGGPFADEATFACEAPFSEVLSNLVPATPVDYIERRLAIRHRTETPAEDTATFETAASYGVPCATASDPDACKSALSAPIDIRNAQNPSMWDGWYVSGDPLGPNSAAPREFLVYTRGNEVGVARTTAEVAALLGPIDTFEEARLLLRTSNLLLECVSDPARSGWRREADGTWSFLVAGYGCSGMLPYRARVTVPSDGTMNIAWQDFDADGKRACGRRPEGLQPHDGAHEISSVGEHFANAAHLEAASVVAFRRLELELLQLRAPKSLVARARRARADEIRHARETARLARRFGHVAPAVVVAPMVPRDLFAIALENVVEGCVRESYGALVAEYQARTAAPELRAVLRQIAIDEARHAELAHDVAAFLDRRLTAAERSKIESARIAALQGLRRDLVNDPSASVMQTAGVPGAAHALALLYGLERFVLAA